MHITFVILHYLAADVTSNCIDSLLSNCGHEDISLVVVDNCSPDGSGASLAGKYSSENRVHFILLERNEGFARGNNAGYAYAVENLNPDFVVVMNNDVIIADSNFVKGIADEYSREPFAVLGPDIWAVAAGVHQNPIRLSPLNLHEVRVLRMKMAAKYRFFLYNYLSWNLKLMLGIAKRPGAGESDYARPHEGCVLHGSCLIFSRDFISERKCAFNPDTFLYTEEDILHLECSRASLVIRYTPGLKVVHLEDASTKAAFSSSYRRDRNKYRCLVQSLDVLSKLLENG